MRFQRGSAVCVSFVIVAEMADFALSAWMRNVFWHSDGCKAAEYAYQRVSQLFLGS